MVEGMPSVGDVINTHHAGHMGWTKKAFVASCSLMLQARAFADACDKLRRASRSARQRRRTTEVELYNAVRTNLRTGVLSLAKLEKVFHAGQCYQHARF